MSASSGNCGATWYWSGTCLVSYWGGLTNTLTGSSGIIQSGVQASVLCFWFFGYSCSSSYSGWIEFYPLWPSYAPSWMISGSGNTIILENYVYSGNYYSIFYDATTGWMYWGWIPAYMGSINYGQFQAENSKSLSGSTYALPSMSGLWYNPILVANDPADLRPYSTQFNALFTPGAMNYNSAACAGTGYSCFQM